MPTGADQVLTRGQSMHRLNRAAVVSPNAACNDSDLESDARLAMLLEGFLGGNGGAGGGQHGGLIPFYLIQEHPPTLLIQGFFFVCNLTLG